MGQVSMDGMREGGERGGESDAQVMAAVGSDERRMHVRAYNYWVSLLKGRAYPSVKDRSRIPRAGAHRDRRRQDSRSLR